MPMKEGMGSFVGAFCYVCKDLGNRDQPDEETLHDLLAGSYLDGLPALLLAAAAQLCARQPDAQPGPDWGRIAEVIAGLRKDKFFGQAPRSWWVWLEEAAGHARELAADGAPLRGAHLLRELLVPAPLRRPTARPWVFVKTFRTYNRKVGPRAIRRLGGLCSMLAEDRVTTNLGIPQPICLDQPGC